MARTSDPDSCSDSANGGSAPDGFQNRDMKQKAERLGDLMRCGGSGRALREFRGSRIALVLFDEQELRWSQWSDPHSTG